MTGTDSRLHDVGATLSVTAATPHQQGERKQGSHWNPFPLTAWNGWKRQTATGRKEKTLDLPFRKSNFFWLILAAAR
jgi:hypothetical protein